MVVIVLRLVVFDQFDGPDTLYFGDLFGFELLVWDRSEVLQLPLEKYLDMLDITDEFVQSLQGRYGSSISKLNLSNNGLRDVRNLRLFATSLVKLTLNQNNMVDIGQFLEFPNLRELYLQENHICEIPPSFALAHLEILDLTGNKIQTTMQLRPLLQMPSLRVLHLTGNPVCARSEYPLEVFRLQPRLAQVDDWSREDVVALDPQLKAPNDGSYDAPTNAIAPHLSSNPQSMIATLQLQVQTMNDAFALQEKALEANGLEAAEYAFGLSAVSGARRSTGHQAAITFPSDTISNYAVEKELVTRFPYYRVLQMWRKKSLSLLLHAQRLRQDLARLYHEQRIDRHHHQQQHQELECTVMKWKARTQTLEEQVKVLTDQVHQLQGQCYAATAAHEESTQHLHHYQGLFQQLQAYLVRFVQGQSMPWALQSLQDVSMTQQVSLRCQRYEEQLTRLEAHVQSLKEHLLYQQVAHRNALAVVEAERRLQRMRFGKHARSGSQAAESPSPSSSAVANATANATANASLSDLQLSPEAESLLKALFQSLDVQGNGCVSLSLWIQSLLQDEATYHRLLRRYRRDRGSSETLDEDDRRVILSGYGQMLVTALGGPLFRQMLHNLLRHLAGSATTHRAEPRERSSSPLTAREWRALSSQGIWKHYQLGLLPLQLPPPATAAAADTPVSMKPAGSGKSSHPPTTMAPAHWAEERRWLTRRLQDQLRHETRLIENVKAYFERELTVAALAQQRLQTQLTTVQEEVHTWQRRHQEAELRRQESQRHSEQQLQAVQQENATLRGKVERFQDTETKQYEALLHEQQQKYLRLEKEHQLIQREASKKDVKLKALERDVLRLQSTHTTATAEWQTTRDSLREELAQGKQDQEAQRLQQIVERQTWEAEKSTLLEKIAALQQELLDVHRAPAPAPPAQAQPPTASATVTEPASSAEEKPTSVPSSAHEPTYHPRPFDQDDAASVRSRTMPTAMYSSSLPPSASKMAESGTVPGGGEVSTWSMAPMDYHGQGSHPSGSSGHQRGYYGLPPSSSQTVHATPSTIAPAAPGVHLLSPPSFFPHDLHPPPHHHNQQQQQQPPPPSSASQAGSSSHMRSTYQNHIATLFHLMDNLLEGSSPDH
eukprot:gene6221-4468_t